MNDLFTHLFNTLPALNMPLHLLEAFLFIILLHIPKILKTYQPENKYWQKSIKKKWLPLRIISIFGIIFILSRIAEVPTFSLPIFRSIIGLSGIIFIVWRLNKVKKDYKRRLRSVERAKSLQNK